MSTYEQWVHSQGIPILREFSIPSLKDVGVGAWGRLDAYGAYILMDGAEDSNDSFFSPDDQNLCEIIVHGEYAINGLRNKDLRHHLADLTGGQMSRRLKDLRVRGMIRRVDRTYIYYLTDLGRHVIVTALKLDELFIVSQLAKPATI